MMTRKCIPMLVAVAFVAVAFVFVGGGRGRRVISIRLFVFHKPYW